MQAMTPISPMERSGEMFTRVKTRSVFLDSWSRPVSHATIDTEFEDDSEIDFGSDPDGSDFDDGRQSPKGTLSSNDSRRRSQTTISSFDEAPTPSSGRGQRLLPLQLKSVEGPKGPHLFRSSQLSSEFDFDFALQMSPMMPKQIPLRPDTSFSQDTVTPVTKNGPQINFSIADLMNQVPPTFEAPTNDVRHWNSTQVIDWMVDSSIDASVIECFEKHDISGDVLMDLTFDDLKELGIESFGRRHQLWNVLSILQGRDGDISPIQTPFVDVSRPCTTNPRRSPSRSRDACETPIDASMDSADFGGKKRRGRKPPKALDVITPAESVSIVAIEQLIPKPHKCAKGERCAKWRKQQRELDRLHDEHGIGRFPISPTNGGHIFVAGNPGNALTADNMISNVQKQPDDFYRPQSEALPSVVASSDLLGPGQLPDFILHADMLDQLEKRDPQENVKAFLNFQHLQSPSPPIEDNLTENILTPVQQQFSTGQQQTRSPTLDLFPAEHVPSFTTQTSSRPELHPPAHTPGPHEQLRSLPKLEIPRSASAQPHLNSARTPHTTHETCRSATASPATVYRLATPASEMDVPVTAFPVGPVSRDSSKSVPPNMQFRDPREQQPTTPARSHSRARTWRRPSLALQAVNENEILLPASSQPRPSMTSHNSSSSVRTGKSTISADSNRLLDPSHDQPQTQYFGYGADCTQAGWMRKRRTKMLRHEWQNAHFRLKGSQLAMHADSSYKTTAKETINVDQYSVACSTAASGSKLSAAFKGLSMKSANSASPEKKGKGADSTAFAFQLVPEAKDRERFLGSKTHHFAVSTKDERIDWMRELMLTKALQQKREGYEVEVNGVQV